MLSILIEGDNNYSVSKLEDKVLFSAKLIEIKTKTPDIFFLNHDAIYLMDNYYVHVHKYLIECKKYNGDMITRLFNMNFVHFYVYDKIYFVRREANKYIPMKTYILQGDCEIKVSGGDIQVGKMKMSEILELKCIPQGLPRNDYEIHFKGEFIPERSLTKDDNFIVENEEFLLKVPSNKFRAIKLITHNKKYFVHSLTNKIIVVGYVPGHQHICYENVNKKQVSYIFRLFNKKPLDILYFEGKCEGKGKILHFVESSPNTYVFDGNKVFYYVDGKFTFNGKTIHVK